MFQTIKNLYRKSVDAVTAIGRNIKSFFSPAIEGEYLGKGDVVRRSFNPRGSLAFAMMFCFLMLPAVSFAAVPADVTTAITTAASAAQKCHLGTQRGPQVQFRPWLQF